MKSTAVATCLFGLVGSIGIAGPITPPNLHFLTGLLLHDAAVIGNEDRETITEKARREHVSKKKLLKEYPIRPFFCVDESGTEASSASVVVAADIILVPGHIFFDEECNLRSFIHSCYLNGYRKSFTMNDVADQYAIDSNTIVSGVSSLKARGLSCSLPRKGQKAGTVPSESIVADWAVVRLRKTVKDIQPLSLQALTSDHETPSDFTMVGALAKNLPEPKDTMLTFQSCSVRDIVQAPRGAFFMKTDCDGGPWMSGSPLIDENHKVVGIMTRATTEDSVRYDARYVYTSVTPISDDIIAAAYKLAGKKPPPMETAPAVGKVPRPPKSDGSKSPPSWQEIIEDCLRRVGTANECNG